MLYYNYNVVALIVEQLSESSTISKSAVPVCHPGVASSMLFMHLGRSSASRLSHRRTSLLIAGPKRARFCCGLMKPCATFPCHKCDAFGPPGGLTCALRAVAHTHARIGHRPRVTGEHGQADSATAAADAHTRPAGREARHPPANGMNGTGSAAPRQSDAAADEASQEVLRRRHKRRRRSAPSRARHAMIRDVAVVNESSLSTVSRAVWDIPASHWLR
jgi:hypothetical protein